MTDAVDDASGMDRNPQDINPPEDHPFPPKEQEVGAKKEHETQHRMTWIDLALYPVIFTRVSIILECLWVYRLFFVIPDAEEQDMPESFLDRTMWIIWTLDFGMMFTVSCDPLAFHHPCRCPEPESKDMRDGRTELQGTMCHGSVQVDRHSHDRQLGSADHEPEKLPSREREASAKPVVHDAPPWKKVDMKKLLLMCRSNED